MTTPMPKDNEVDEKARPVAWIVTNGGESCEPWLEYEQSEVDALPAVCITEPLYSAATVAELRAEVERLSGLLEEGGRRLIDENMRANAAERRVGELEAELRQAMELLAYATYHDGRYKQREYEKFQRPAHSLLVKLAYRFNVNPYDSVTGADPT